jgi:hypothetical protein
VPLIKQCMHAERLESAVNAGAVEGGPNIRFSGFLRPMIEKQFPSVILDKAV